jgi:hypothetical protein
MGTSESYYQRRIEEELAAAEHSVDPAVANVHREMARRYRGMLDDRLRLVTESREAGVRVSRFNGA